MIKARTPEEQAEYLRRQIEEMRGPDNTWFVTQALGHIPTPSEAATYYINHGGATDFANRWREGTQQ